MCRYRYSAFFLTFLFSFLIIRSATCLRILQIVPGASDSHVNFNYKFAEMLNAAGHNVTILTLLMPFGNKVSPPKTPKNVEEIRFAPSFIEKSGEEKFSNHVFKPLQMSQVMELIRVYTEISVKLCNEVSDDELLMEQLSHHRFELAFSHFVTQCPAGIVEKLKIPKFMWVVPGVFLMETAIEVLHLPNLASYIPYYSSAYSDRMSFFERTMNFLMEFFFITLNTLLPSLTDRETEAFRKFPNEKFPHLYSIAENNVQALLVNGEEFLDFPRPLFTNVLHMGDLKTTRSKRLNEDWQTFMDESQDGVIIFSLGTIANTSLMPMELKTAFLKAFAQFSTYSVVWRLEGEMPVGISEQKHIKIAHWLPQIDMLRHPKCKLFITHGGYNSLLETVQAGVPMVLIPLFGDQYGNAKRAVRYELGLTLDKMEYDSEKIAQVIRKALSDHRYSDNAKKFASLLKDKIIPSENLTLHTIEKIVRSAKWPVVRAPKRLNYLQYYCLDIVFFYLFVFFVVLYWLLKIVKNRFKKICIITFCIVFNSFLYIINV